MTLFKNLKSFSLNGYRYYETPNKKKYPSITSVLGKTCPEEKKQSLQNWQNSLGKEAAATITKDSASKGTAVHLMVERFLNKQNIVENEFTPKQVNSFKSLKLKLNKIDNIVAQELALYSDTLELAGRTDCIGNYNRIPSVIDFKTSNRLKSDKDIFDYKLQCTFYGIAFNELYETDIDQGVILMTAETGFPLEFTFPLHPFIEPLIERIELFYSQVNRIN
jgi:genome maintenance exonuclease 1